MHLSPPVSLDEAFEHLRKQAVLAWGEEHAAAVEEDLRLVAEAMAQVSQVKLARTDAPLFP